jgi:phage terminase small subunit
MKDRSELLNGLTRGQRTFVLEKLTGLNDKDAAIAAGYSLSVAENTKQRIWKAKVRAEYERLKGQLFRIVAERARISRAES